MTIELSTGSAVLIKELISEFNKGPNWYEIVESLGIGIGSLLVGIGALYTLIPWVDKKWNELNIQKKVNFYKDKYPVEDIGKSFELIWFNGKLILFDYTEKKYHHIYPWETAEDLNFVSFGIHVKDYFPNPKEKTIELGNSRKLNIDEYKNGGSINTQTLMTK